MLRDSVRECLPNANLLERPDYTEPEVHALRALQAGEATPEQQVMALKYMHRAFGTDDVSYRQNNQYDTAFAEGRRFAGTTLVWMLNVAPTRTDPDKIAVRNVKNE